MRDHWTRKTTSDLLGRAIALSLALVCFSGTALKAQDEDCARTSHMRVYSSAYVHDETGDLLGYELALSTTHASTTEALLFVHEGSPGVAVPLNGHLQNGNLVIDGEWVERLVEYPSKKETVQTQSVKIRGTVDEHRFQGTIAIGISQRLRTSG